MNANVVVVGAGAAGLAAARELVEAGRSVVVLEARPAPGGRIATERVPGFPCAIELGPEFVHGRAPETRRWLDSTPVEGMAEPSGGDEDDIRWSELGEVLGQLDREGPDRSVE